MSCIDHMGSGYVSQTSHRACLLTITTKALMTIDPAVMLEILSRRPGVNPLEAKANSSPLDSNRYVELAEEADLSREPVAKLRSRSPPQPLKYGNSTLYKSSVERRRVALLGVVLELCARTVV